MVNLKLEDKTLAGLKSFFPVLFAIFSNGIYVQSKYSSKDAVNIIRNAIVHKMYRETCVRNYNECSQHILLKEYIKLNMGITLFTMPVKWLWN